MNGRADFAIIVNAMSGIDVAVIVVYLQHMVRENGLLTEEIVGADKTNLPTAA